MNAYTACELAYKNGFEAGKESVNTFNTEVTTRVKVAYEQLAKCHTDLCSASNQGENIDPNLIYSFQEAMQTLLDIQVKLCVLKKEEDIK